MALTKIMVPEATVGVREESGLAVAAGAETSILMPWHALAENHTPKPQREQPAWCRQGEGLNSEV